jgi:hypothetical protein
MADKTRQPKSLTKLDGMAVRKRWPVTDGARQKLVQRMESMLGSSDERFVIAASKVMATIESQNQADEHLDRKEARTDEGKVNERVEVVFRNQIAGNDHGAG